MNSGRGDGVCCVRLWVHFMLVVVWWFLLWATHVKIALPHLENISSCGHEELREQSGSRCEEGKINVAIALDNHDATRAVSRAI